VAQTQDPEFKTAVHQKQKQYSSEINELLWHFSQIITVSIVRKI
jgi:hypothetical protein